MSNQMEAQALPEFDLADRMRKTLRESGIGISEMALYLGVSRASVSNWINGRVVPTGPTLLAWAAKCGVTSEWLVGGA